jgi:hypothetical protein
MSGWHHQSWQSACRLVAVRRKIHLMMRRSRLRIALLASAALAAGGLVLAPAPEHPAVAVADTTTATGAAGLFVPATGRLLDTRNGTGGYTSPMAANTVRTVSAAGVAGIPAIDVSALALTLTAVGASTAGAISVAPGDVASPTGTALVFNPGDSVSNTDLVALHADGNLHVVSNAAVNLIIDVQGYFTAGSATAPGGFVPVDQARIVDTRIGVNAPQGQVPSGGSITVTAAGLGGVPAGASAVYVNIAILGQNANGYLRTYAADAPVPTTGALGFDDTTQAESVAIPLSNTGAFTVLVGAGGPVDLLVDIQGFFTASTADSSFTPAAVHLLDTRAAPVRTLAGNSVLTLSVAGVAGIPAVADGLGTVALNLRTVQTGAPSSGFLRVWPSDSVEPATSSINYTSANTYRTDLAIVAPAADGTVSIRNGGPGPIDLVVDVEGWFAYPLGPKPDDAKAAPGDHGPVFDPSGSPPPSGDGQNETISGVLTNPAGQPIANLPVMLSVPQTAATDGSDSTPTVLGTVTTDANGVWSYTPPATLPSAVQAVVDANGGVLNVEAEAAGTAPDGTLLTGSQAVSMGVPTSASSALTDAAVEANQFNQSQPAPQSAAVHVVALNTPDAAPPTDAQAAQSGASIAQDNGVTDYQAPNWENNAGLSSPYSPDVVNGVDYRSASITPMNLFDSCYVTATTVKTTTVYTVVGEAHAYWDAQASFTFNKSLSNSIGIKVSADGSHWSVSGAWTLESQTGISTGFPLRGPYFAHQYQIPLRYVWVKRKHTCHFWPGTPYWSYTTYEIDPVGYSIPPGGYPGRIGNDVSDNDGYARFVASKPTYRAVVQRGTFLSLYAGRSITYGLAATAFGVGISLQTIYNSNHEQRIQAGNGYASHDIWGARGPIDHNPGVFYSW